MLSLRLQMDQGAYLSALGGVDGDRGQGGSGLSNMGLSFSVKGTEGSGTLTAGDCLSGVLKDS